MITLERQEREKLAKYLKEKRMASGKTQKEVAVVMGYTTPQFVSNWERGLISPPLSSISKIAELYGLTDSEIRKKLEEVVLAALKRELKTS